MCLVNKRHRVPYLGAISTEDDLEKYDPKRFHDMLGQSAQFFKTSHSERAKDHLVSVSSSEAFIFDCESYSRRVLL